MDDLPRTPGLCAEQIVCLTDAETPAALVDGWGRAHPLDATTVIGRVPAEVDLAVLQESVSRRHAELTRDAAGVWSVRDLGSTNGTWIDGRRVERPTPLVDLTRLTIGHVAFAFVVDGAAAGARAVTASIRRTAALEPRTPSPTLILSEPTGGGGGVASVRGEPVQLAVTQYALLATLARRHAAEATQPEDVRGFVRSGELLADLPWNTPHPDENHLKQLVRRVRRALEKAGLPDAIESRHGFGYRLGVPATLG